jgi:hypothetical protein
LHGPPISGVFLKHASEQVLQILAWSEPFGSPEFSKVSIL